MKLNLKAVEERVAPLGGRESYDRGLIFELLLAYGERDQSVCAVGQLSVLDLEQPFELVSTYLMAPVEIVADYRTNNLKASALEHLLHRVFAEVRLDITQIDAKGRDYDPSEWFVVPLNVINQAVSMIMSGEIVDYIYDPARQTLMPRLGGN